MSVPLQTGHMLSVVEQGLTKPSLCGAKARKTGPSAFVQGAFCKGGKRLHSDCNLD